MLKSIDIRFKGMYPPVKTPPKEDMPMDQFDRYLQYNMEVAEAKLKVIERFQKQEHSKLQKRTSNIEVVKYVLQSAGQALHISEIIRLAKQEHDAELNRDSIVSAILKKANAGLSFVRTAPNTFSLKTDSSE